MKLRCILLFAGICFLNNFVNAQSISISPNNSDFCTGTFVTYATAPFNPGNTIEWYHVDYSNYSLSGQEFPTLIGYGNVLNINASPGVSCPGGFIRAVEKDGLGNTVYESTVAMLTSINASLNHMIPIYVDPNFTPCFGLSVPPCFDPQSTIPYNQQRWAMWYKNGIPTGVSSYFLPGPLTDSAWYEYKVRLTCGDTLSTGLYYLGQPPAPIITAQGPTTFCTGDSVTMVLSNAAFIDQWYKDGVAITGSNGKSVITVGASGQYTAKIKFLDLYGGYCLVTSNSISVTQNPGAFISGSTVFCSTDSVQLNCTAASSYQWKKNGVNISGGTTQSIWVKATGNYTVTTTGLTCNTSPVKTVTKYPVPSGLTLTPAGSYSLCNGNSTTISLSGNNITSWQWQRNNVAMSGANSSSMVATKAGTYSCVVTNAIGCSKTTASVQVSALPVAALPQKTVQLQPGSEGIDSYTSNETGFLNANFGTKGTLRISNWYTLWVLEKAFLQFDLSQIPDFSAVSSATLKLYVDTIAQKGVNAGLPNYLYLERNTQSWNENTITRNNSPANTTFQSLAIPCSTITSSSFLYANITDMVRHWTSVPAEQFGMILRVNEANQYTWLSIASSDTSAATYRPKLTITYYAADINASGPLNLCTGGSVQFSTNAGAYTYQWYKNGNPIAGATAATYTATTAGDYHVVLTVASGCTARSLVKKVTVNGLPQINLTPSADSVSYCYGSPIQLKADSLAGYTFLWKKNNVNIAGAVYSSYSPTTTAWYTIKTTSNCGISAKDSVYVTRINNPTPVISAGGPTTFCAGQNVLLNSTTFSGATTKWYQGTSLVATATSYTASTAGSYSVTQTASGCSKTSNIINVIVNCREGDFNSEEVLQMTIYPNPAADQLMIEINGNDQHSTLLYSLKDINGKVILRFESAESSQPVNIAAVSSGVYILEASINGSPTARQRLIIER